MAVELPRPVDPAVDARRQVQRARTEALQADYRHELNVRYGSHARQVLDLYYPEVITADAPVLVFLHGGGFRAGGPGFVGFQGRPYLERGAIFVSMGYRLIPDARFPDCCADVEEGVLWLRSRFADAGGNADRLYLSGHSAGAMLAAWVGLRQSAVDDIAGLVLISGMYNLDSHSFEIINRESPRYVADLSQAIERVPPHTILVAGDHDLPAVLPGARSLLGAIQARGGSAELFVEPDADHYAANRSFVASEGQVSQAVLTMMSLS